VTPAKPLSEIIDPSGARALAPVEPTVHEIGERLRQEVASGVGYLPAGTDVLRAFTYPMEDARALIAGSRIGFDEVANTLANAEKLIQKTVGE